MRSLTATLLAAQKEATRTHYVKVEAKNKMAGVVRLDWTRLYTGSEDDYFHALTMPGDGSLVRARVTLPDDSRKLYRQRLANPGPSSDFSQWTYCGQYDCLAVATASLGAEVSIFWINSSREIQRLKSADYGASWGSPELIDYSPTTAVYGLAAAYKPNGDLAIFFADQSTLYVEEQVSGSWQDKVAWDKTTGDLSGVAVVYDADWNLLLTGKDTDDNFKLWSLIYGDGGDVPADTWSDLKEFASAPSDGDFDYLRPFMDKPDVYRSFYVEKFTGTETYSRPFWTHSIPDADFTGSLWREPVPFNLASEYGLAIAHYGNYCWLSSPASVWRASMTVQSLDLTGYVLSVKQELASESGRVSLELRNDAGQYASPGEGELSLLKPGCQLEVGPGYVTSQGNEISLGSAFWLDAYEHLGSEGKASLMLYAADGWYLMANWRARYQFRWNKDAEEMSVKQILEFMMARAGLKLEVKSQSSVVTGYYPDFTIYAGDRGDSVIKRLLSFVPDVLFMEGNKAYLVNPQSADSSVYSYGSGHSILEGRYQQGAWGLNHILVEGYGDGAPIIVNSFAWSELNRFFNKTEQLYDGNLDTVVKAQELGEAYLRKAEVNSASGMVRIPVNCGQQLWDVIDVTDSRAGLSAVKKRVLGIAMVYTPRRGEYQERLSLGAV